MLYINLDPRKAAKTGQTKDNMEEEGRERKEKAGWKNWGEVQIAAADRAGWRDWVRLYVPHRTKKIGNR